MPRKRIPPTPLNISRRNELQYGFLETTNRACPEVVEDLKNVRRGQLPFDQFAEKYGIRGTWIEEAEAAIGAAQKRLNAIDKDVLDDYGSARGRRQRYSPDMPKKVISVPSADHPEKGRALAERHTRVICHIGGKRYALDFWSRASEIKPVDAEVLPFPPRPPHRK
jgi:hypothetical protein